MEIEGLGYGFKKIFCWSGFEFCCYMSWECWGDGQWDLELVFGGGFGWRDG